MQSLSAYNLHLVSMVDALEVNGGASSEEEEQLFALLERTVLQLSQCLDRLEIVQREERSVRKSLSPKPSSGNSLSRTSPPAMRNHKQESRIQELEAAVKGEVLKRIQAKFGSP